jgi:hypothetical protein
MTNVSKAAFRRAVCQGLLAGCEMEWGINCEVWVRNGVRIAAKRTGIMGTTYYLSGGF